LKYPFCGSFEPKIKFDRVPLLPVGNVLWATISETSHLATRFSLVSDFSPFDLCYVMYHSIGGFIESQTWEFVDELMIGHNFCL
jgi:hypothetical protein